MDYDNRQQHLRKDLGIDWDNTPVIEPVDDTDISENAVIKYRLEMVEEEKKAREAAQELEKQFAGKSADQIRAEWQQQQHAEQEAALPARREEAIRQFLLEAPEVVNSERNGQRIGEYFRAVGLRGDSPDQFHQAYRALASRGLIKVDEDKRPRQPRKQLTQADLETMPLDQLKALANAEMRKSR